MPQIVFAAISPHPPIILPSVGSKEDRKQVKNTIENLESLGRKLEEAKPDSIIISAPHTDWGFNVPLFFLGKDFKGEIKKYLIEIEPPEFYFRKGKKTFEELDKNKKYALIASGDLSHCLKEDGPYGFNSQGPEFDKDLVTALEEKDIEKILKLDDVYPEAGECGLRSFCFILGILEASAHSTGSSAEAHSKSSGWQPEILSYEGPFGVGYLVANFKLL